MRLATLLHLFPTDDDTAPELSADAIKVFSAALGSRIKLSEPQPMTAAKAPAAFDAAFVLEAGCDVQAVTKAVIAAFAAAATKSAFQNTMMTTPTSRRRRTSSKSSNLGRAPRADFSHGD